MSNDIKTVLIEDDRINGITDTMDFGVFRGPQNSTYQSAPVVGSSTSSVVFNAVLPSETTLIDRQVLWHSDVELEISGTPPQGKFLIEYGFKDSLAPYPLHMLAQVMNATINQNTVSLNVRDLLPMMLRMTDQEKLQKYNQYCPTMYDTLSVYADGVGDSNSALGGFANTNFNGMGPRGAFKLNELTEISSGGAPSADGAQTAGNGQVKIVKVKFTSTETLLLSPFIWAHPEYCPAMFGVNAMNFNFVMGDARRVWRSANKYQQSVKLVSFDNNRLEFNFLTPKMGSGLQSSRNVVPYYNLHEYITSNLGDLGTLADPKITSRVTTSSLQLNSIPDSLWICARKAMGKQQVWDPDCFYVIKKLSVSFANQSGLLSSMTQEQIWETSVSNGSNQSWHEFKGIASKCRGDTPQIAQDIHTSGSLVVLQFGKDITMNEGYLSQGSIGQYNLQVEVEVENQGAFQQAGNGDTATAKDWEVVLVTMQSGAFVNDRSTSATYTAMLTADRVMEAFKKEPHSENDVKRIVGGGFLDSLKSVAGKVAKHGPAVAKLGCELLDGKDGAGYTGGGTSGGGTSGGKKKRSGLDLRM